MGHYEASFRAESDRAADEKKKFIQSLSASDQAKYQRAEKLLEEFDKSAGVIKIIYDHDTCKQARAALIGIAFAT